MEKDIANMHKDMLSNLKLMASLENQDKELRGKYI